METWTALFGSDHPDVAQETARAVLLFGYGLALVRFAGRRVFGKWSALDIIVSIIVGSNLSRALTGNAPLLGTMVASAALMALHGVLARAAARWPGVSRWLEGSAKVLAEDGRPVAGTIERQAVSAADLAEALRQSGLETVADARKVMLEPSGKITVLKRG